MTLARILDNAFEPVRRAVDDRQIPGAVLGLVTAAGERAVSHAGLAQVQPTEVGMRRQTVFDLASLTKVIFTTTTIMRLVEQGKVALDQPLSELIPDLRQYDLKAAERMLSVRQCLAHQTFLPAVEPLYTYGQDPQTLRAFVLQRAWQHGPAVYSDINFILLGIAIERVTGITLKQQPLADGFTFTPDPLACAATEHCRWRDRILRGEVHDENAFALGGASGHAGLFGSIDAVLDFAAGYLNGTILRPETISLVCARHSAQRALGWEIKYDGWSGGTSCPEETIGHTGFTGTGLWIDRSRGVAWSLLTNRVHPTRHAETGIALLRQTVGQSIGQDASAT